MPIQFSILAWEIPWTEEPGGLQSWGHKESDMTEHKRMHMQTHMRVSTHTYTYTYTSVVKK